MRGALMAPSVFPLLVLFVARAGPRLNIGVSSGGRWTLPHPTMAGPSFEPSEPH